MEQLFFSIIIPAHNEAEGIANTLDHLRKQEYPAERFEVLVVENGSSDGTFEIAKKSEGANIRILQSGTGVSRAKNAGIDHLSERGDWVIFLDADTVPEPQFLQELNTFLSKPNRYSVGTVSLLPDPDTRKARLWFRFYDYGHVLTKASYSISIVRRSVFPPVRFNEALVTGEDLNVIRQALVFGNFFFMWTGSVRTSTRRFDREGWWRTLFYWTIVAALPATLQRRFRYNVVR
jgi:glycosyltransferase involved in cell wall biosynthesis